MSVRDRVAAVCIGRNEGQRLLRCIDAASPQVVQVVFADSGSTDGSSQRAQEKGVAVVTLDDSRPQSAARARNAGFTKLNELGTSFEFVQFIDGDTELDPNWVEAAVAAFDADPGLVLVCGQLREKDAKTSIYRRLCDMEWDKPSGPIIASGGIMMLRREAFAAAGGFDDTLVGGEEAELCDRLRVAGGTLVRIPALMGLHDSGMTHFSQWWRRAYRGGYWDVVAANNPGFSRQAEFRRRTRSRLLWGALMPFLLIVNLVAAAWHPVFLMAAGTVMLALLVNVYRGTRYMQNRDRGIGESWLYGASCLVAKLPELHGQFSCMLSPPPPREPLKSAEAGA